MLGRTMNYSKAGQEKAAYFCVTDKKTIIFLFALVSEIKNDRGRCQFNQDDC